MPPMVACARRSSAIAQRRDRDRAAPCYIARHVSVRPLFLRTFGSRTARRPERQAHKDRRAKDSRNRRADRRFFFAGPASRHEGISIVIKTQASTEGWFASSERTSQTDDLRIVDVTPLPPPEHLIRFFPIAGTPVETLIGKTRAAIRRIMQRQDDRLLVIIGPCSIHDPVAAVEYARRLKAERERHADTLEIVMRVYFEKPRTTVGWKGLINDPYLDETYRHRRGPAHRSPAAARDQPPRHAGRQRVPRRHLAAVPRRPDRVGRDRGTHDREPGSSRAGLGPVGADRLQERDRRQHPHRDRRDPGGRAAAPLPVGAQERPGRDRRDARQQGLPRDPARRQGAELRRRARRGRLPRDRGREARLHA